MKTHYEVYINRQSTGKKYRTRFFANRAFRRTVKRYRYAIVELVGVETLFPGTYYCFTIAIMGKE